MLRLWRPVSDPTGHRIFSPVSSSRAGAGGDESWKESQYSGDRGNTLPVRD